ncbi:MAG: tRNA epoxyqueuosine(34) reductase QueG [Gammaproteobacteria bacterium]|nr:tRNA epoxyqueuosine(34) reductase QueG [Gammaproteobacteria bacterium]NBX40456.1 tRNA epoxyqueuosine(34) reductase QueG [Gammaproteobacteria bacterium]
MSTVPDSDFNALRRDLDAYATELGFAGLGVANIALEEDERHLLAWLEAGMHGQMHYMQRHGVRRARPAELKPGTLRVISVRMDYWPSAADDAWETLADGRRAYVSRYALGRDYHKLMRNALQKLADRIAERIGPFGHRVFVDSGPVLEKALARNAGLGWIGKHTNLIARDAGSWFFLGELYTDLPLPADAPASGHCGTCSACMPACPTGAIVAPWKLDARRCISYLTIELDGAIPVELRPLLGNRIYGCDDCQLVCPWNKFARAASHPTLAQLRNSLDTATLIDLFAWSAEDFDLRMRGSAIRRIGHERWLRNIAVALGNGPADDDAKAALRARANDESALVREHVAWALARLTEPRAAAD